MWEEGFACHEVQDLDAYRGAWAVLTEGAAGPPNFTIYMTIWVVLVVALKKLMAVAGHALKTYNRRIAKLVELWPECWRIIYQADDLMRSEHMEKIRRKIVREINDGGAKPAYWDENSPWTTVFIAAAGDTTFWDEHVTQLATS